MIQLREPILGGVNLPLLTISLYSDDFPILMGLGL